MYVLQSSREGRVRGKLGFIVFVHWMESLFCLGRGSLFDLTATQKYGVCIVLSTKSEK